MRIQENNKPEIVFVATFPPRECGIATFTQDLVNAVSWLYSGSLDTVVCAMNDKSVVKYTYPSKVLWQINEPNRKEYTEVAKEINQRESVSFVNVQHEYGIFGGDYGEYLVDFLSELKKPVLLSMHTVVPAPNQKLFEVTKRLLERVDKVTVMTNLAKETLKNDYRVEESLISVIPHGIHPMRYRASKKPKAKLGLAGKTVLTTFGLLSRNKGIENVIEALPEVVKRYPDVVYLVVGQTHPVVRRRDGEEYRNYLVDKVYELGLGEHVRFYNKYFGLGELLDFLQATDIYLAPSLDLNQAVSGTLSYALAAGRPVISSPFSQAREIIDESVGRLVDEINPDSIREAILDFLAHPKALEDRALNAYFKTREMTWPNVALSYMNNFSRIVPDLKKFCETPPALVITHLLNLTDDFGVVQFARLTEPELSSGYTTDDVARALVLAGLHYEQSESPITLSLINLYLNFLNFVSKRDGGFENYVGHDREIQHSLNRSVNLEDSTGRALYALARVASIEGVPDILRTKARKLFSRNINNEVLFQSPRAAAFFVKGLYYWMSNKKNEQAERLLRRHCDKLISWYEDHASPDWQWFESYLTYANASLPEALLLGYKLTGEEKYLTVGKKTLDFLVDHSFEDGMLVPIGQRKWFGKGKSRSRFDQQPEEAAAMVKALKSIHSITGEERYAKLMHRSFSWFLGRNSLNQLVYDPVTGGSYDGLSENSVNLNQGAESTISYLLARLAIEDN